MYIARYNGGQWYINPLLNLETATSFNGKATQAGVGMYGAIGVKAWYFSTTGGYIVFSNGLIIQWGFDSANGTSGTSKQFPLSFTSMWIGGASNRQGWATGNINYIDNSHYVLTSAYGSGSGLTDKVSWFAIGY